MVCADRLPCGSRSYMSALAGHRDGTRQRSDVIVVRGDGGGRSGGQSLVTIVESTNLWKGDDLACFGALDRSEDRAVLTQRQVSARAVVVVEMRCENACTYSDQWVDHLVK